MKHYLLALGVLVLGLGVAYGGGFLHEIRHDLDHDRGAAQHADTFTWRGDLSEGHLIEIKGVNGGIAAVASPGREVVVRARKKGRGRLDDVRVEVVEHDAGVTICAVYPTRGARQVCRPGDGGSLGNQNSDVAVSFEVEVPDGVWFRGSTVNGSVKADGLSKPVRASSVNGSIQISTDGWAEANTVNGSIRAEVGDVGFGGEMLFTTTNGQITLVVPRSLSATLAGMTMSGGIQSDFPVKVTGEHGQRVLDGVLGMGGEMIRLETVNGSIRIIERN